MGRTKWSYRQLVEDCESISIPWLKRYGYLNGYKNGGIEWRYPSGDVNSIGITTNAFKRDKPNSYLRIQYAMTNRQTGDKSPYNYKVELVTTPCNLGGERFWFICPLVTNGIPCRRRVGKLYLPPGGPYFGCRHCYNLTYRSCREHDKRVDHLVKNPELLEAIARSGNIKKFGLVLSALHKRINDPFPSKKKK